MLLQAKKRLEGAYAIAVLDYQDPIALLLQGTNPHLLIGLGTDENLAASDPLAIAQLTNEFIFLEDGDVARISSDSYEIFDTNQASVQRAITKLDITSQATSKGDYRHFMEKEIYEQPEQFLTLLTEGLALKMC